MNEITKKEWIPSEDSKYLPKQQEEPLIISINVTEKTIKISKAQTLKELLTIWEQFNLSDDFKISCEC